MAYPGEAEHDAYQRYLMRWSLGEETGPKLSKKDFVKREQEKPSKKKDTPALTLDFDKSDHL